MNFYLPQRYAYLRIHTPGAYTIYFTSWKKNQADLRLTPTVKTNVQYTFNAESNPTAQSLVLFFSPAQ